MPTSELLDGFLLSLEAANRSPATLIWYSKRLRSLVRFTADAPAREIGADQIRRWLIRVKAGTAGTTSDSYVEAHRKAAAALFAWAVREQHLKESPMRVVARYRIERGEIAVLSIEEVQHLIAAFSARTAQGARNRTIIALMYDTGIRVGELVQLHATDADLVAGELHVRLGKSRRARVVPISPAMRNLLWNYLHGARPQLLAGRGDPGRLFVSRSGVPIRETSINQWLRRCARVAGVTGKRVSPHTFRHTFATEYLRNGGGELDLQKILGHSSLEMVRRYVHMVNADVRARHLSASPLERLVRTA